MRLARPWPWNASSNVQACPAGSDPNGQGAPIPTPLCRVNRARHRRAAEMMRFGTGLKATETPVALPTADAQPAPPARPTTPGDAAKDKAARIDATGDVLACDERDSVPLSTASRRSDDGRSRNGNGCGRRDAAGAYRRDHRARGAAPHACPWAASRRDGRDCGGTIRRGGGSRRSDARQAGAGERQPIPTCPAPSPASVLASPRIARGMMDVRGR